MSRMQAIAYTAYLYATVFCTGAIVLIVEILGTRVLAPFYGSTVYVWSSMIAVAMAFLALGYALGGILADRYRHPRLLSFLLAAAAVSLFLVVRIDVFVLLQTESLGIRLGPLAAAGALFSVPLLCLAAISPVAVALHTTRLDQLGKSAGSLYATATLGSLVGALVTGFYLITRFSITTNITALACILAALFLGWLFVQRSRVWVKAATVAIVVFASMGIASLPSEDDAVQQTMKILFHGQSFYGDVKVIDLNPYRCLLVNGLVQSCANQERTTDSSYVRLIRAMAQAHETQSMLLVGAGGGGLISVMPEDMAIEAVELDPMLIVLAEEFALLPTRDFALHIDDARHFIRHSERQYDMVVIDAFVGDNLPYYLLSHEALQEVADVLSPDGMLVINTAAELTPGDPFSELLINTLASVFPQTTIVTGKDNLHSRTLVTAHKAPSDTLAGFETMAWNIDAHGPVARDDFNVFEAHFLPHALAFREDSQALGTAMFLSE